MIQVTTLTCNIQVKQRYGTMLAAAASNCAVTNTTYNENNYLCRHVNCLSLVYGAPFVKIYLTDLAQKLLSLRIFSYLCAHLAMSAQR